MRTLRTPGLWLLLAGVSVAWLVPPALADGLGLAVSRVDATQFPVVRMYTSAATAEGIPITGLDARAFEVREDGKPVDGLQVEPIVDSQEPISTALVVDTSGSMGDEGKLDNAREAASAFVDTLGVADRVTIVSFATQVKVAQDYTGDKAALKKALGALAAQGDTHLYDAVTQTARRQAKQVQRRRALIVLTDGEDTKSAESLQSSISAAQVAGSPIFVIGLGSDVKKDILDRLASTTGGQAIYVSDARQLKQTFLSIGDQLRREYALRYTSRLPSDDKAHALAVKLSYTGQEAAAQASFNMPKPAAPLAITGLSATAPLEGLQHIGVDVPPGTQLVQLLVDDQPRTGASAPPFAFDWDSGKETPGQHRIVIRAVDAQGNAIDRTYIVTVASPAPTPVPTPVAVPTVLAAPTAPPVAAPVAGGTLRTTDSGFNWGAVALLLLVLLLVCGLLALVYFGSRRLKLAPIGLPPARPAPSNDDTDLIGSLDAGEVTFERAAAAPQPTARVRVARGGEEHEVALDSAEVTIGRDDGVTIPIKDALASRTHARIVRQDGQFWIEDLRSLNGTQVNGEAVTRRKLTNSDRITIGETILTFVIETRGGDRQRVGGLK